jgi:glycosyltransferase involved in cell wall biosynthesis
MHAPGTCSTSVIEFSDAGQLEKDPLVSVVILTYNHSRYIARAVESVLDQSRDFAIEVLIGEDCSTDETRQIVLDLQRRHPGVIRVLSSLGNVGVFENYRRLLRASRGEYIAHLDGDDYWLAGKLATQVAALRNEPGCVAVYSNAITVDRGDHVIGHFNDAGTRRIRIAELLRRGNYLNTSSMVFRASVRHYLIDGEAPFLDFRGHLRFARDGYLLHIGEPLAAYRVESEGSMVARANDQVRQLYWEAILDVPREIVGPSDVALGIANFLRRVALRSVRVRQWRLFSRWWPVAASNFPYPPPLLLMLVLAQLCRALLQSGLSWLRPGAARVLHRR